MPTSDSKMTIYPRNKDYYADAVKSRNMSFNAIIKAHLKSLKKMCDVCMSKKQTCRIYHDGEIPDDIITSYIAIYGDPSLVEDDDDYKYNVDDDIENENQWIEYYMIKTGSISMCGKCRTSFTSVKHPINGKKIIVGSVAFENVLETHKYDSGMNVFYIR